MNWSASIAVDGLVGREGGEGFGSSASSIQLGVRMGPTGEGAILPSPIPLGRFGPKLVSFFLETVSHPV